MTCYLTIMVTALVAIQIIRLVQNTIQLSQLRKQLERTSNNEDVWKWDYTYKAYPETGDSPEKHIYRT